MCGDPFQNGFARIAYEMVPTVLAGHNDQLITGGHQIVVLLPVTIKRFGNNKNLPSLSQKRLHFGLGRLLEHPAKPESFRIP